MPSYPPTPHVPSFPITLPPYHPAILPYHQPLPPPHLRKLLKPPLPLPPQPLYLLHQRNLSPLARAGRFDLFLEVFHLFRLEQLDERVELGELGVDLRGGGGGAGGLEVVGRGDDGRDGLYVS